MKSYKKVGEIKMEDKIDSFLLFCDEMQVAEEGLSDIASNVWSSIKRSTQKAKQWFRKLLLNINYFKDATLDTVMNSDLLKVLKMSQPRTELNFKPINVYYKALSALGKKDGKVNRFAVGEVYEHVGYSEQFSELVKRSTMDVNQSIKATKNSAEYKRLQRGKYDYKTKQNIPLSNIVSDLKSCDNLLSSTESQMNQIEASFNKVKSEEKKSLMKKMNIFLHNIINYCKFRISIIGRYLRYAKASIKGLIHNIGKNDVKSKADLKYHIPKISKRVNVSNFSELKEAYEKMKTAMTYEEYKPCYDKVTSILGISGYVIKQLKLIEAANSAIVMAVKDDGESIEVSTQRLFHSSDNPNIPELVPTFKSKSNTTFYPTPRVYAHLSIPANRLGSSIQMSSEKGDTVLYEITTKVKTAYVDREIGKTAVFINTDKPLKIKKLDYNRYKKTNETKLGFEKE